MCLMLSVVFDSFLCAGCAFVTFSTKQSAQNAIKAVHQSTTMEVSESKTKSKKTQDYSSLLKKLYSLSFFFELNQLFVENDTNKLKQNLSRTFIARLHCKKMRQPHGDTL